MEKLKVFNVINGTERNSCVDVFRCLAIVSVVIYHFNGRLPYGYLGVDLFFVISGLLVGGLLFKDFIKEKPIQFFKFILQRGFKIWPSYYAFILIGNIIAYTLYHSTKYSNQIIPIHDFGRYLLFYQNYASSAAFNLSFDHIWSLCVEEHFYILLPILFILIQKFIPCNKQMKGLVVSLFLVILFGLSAKIYSCFISLSDSFSTTHNRIDALAWGVLLAVIINNYGEKLKNIKTALSLFTSGAALFILTIAYVILNNGQDYLIQKLFLHFILPISFSLLILGAFNYDFSNWKIIRFISYYSYNWYLWHLVFCSFFSAHLGDTLLGLFIYIFSTFIIAFLATILIEEPFLQRRKKILGRIFTN
jgi:peptidoglycan/LPS O-acetylase OafA/YrhL